MLNKPKCMQTLQNWTELYIIFEFNFSLQKLILFEISKIKPIYFNIFIIYRWT